MTTYIRAFVHLHTGLERDKEQRGTVAYGNKSRCSVIKMLKSSAQFSRVLQRFVSM
jgi:hypothetical protein